MFPTTKWVSCVLTERHFKMYGKTNFFQHNNPFSKADQKLFIMIQNVNIFFSTVLCTSQLLLYLNAHICKLPIVLQALEVRSHWSY